MDLNNNVFLESDHTSVHLAFLVSKEEEFQKFAEYFKLDTKEAKNDSMQFKFLQFRRDNFLYDIVCLNTQGIQTFAIRATAYLLNYEPQYTMLLGTAASKEASPKTVCYVDAAFNYEEGKKEKEVFKRNTKTYESQPYRTWFGDTIVKGAVMSGSAVRNDGIPEWNELKIFRRDLIALDMECSAFFEACIFLRIPCLGSLKGIVDSSVDKNDAVHREVWLRIAEAVKDNVIPNIQNLRFLRAHSKYDGEKLAQQYYDNFLKHLTLLLSKDKLCPIYLIKIPEEKLKASNYDSLPITVMRLKLEEYPIDDKVKRRTWSIFTRNNKFFDIPTIINVILEDLERTKNYAKFWAKLANLIKENEWDELVLIVPEHLLEQIATKQD